MRWVTLLPLLRLYPSPSLHGYHPAIIFSGCFSCVTEKKKGEKNNRPSTSAEIDTMVEWQQRFSLSTGLVMCFGKPIFTRRLHLLWITPIWNGGMWTISCMYTCLAGFLPPFSVALEVYTFEEGWQTLRRNALGTDFYFCRRILYLRLHIVQSIIEYNDIV